MRHWGIVLGTILGLSFAPEPVRAQETRAIVSGTVTDPQGASVPAAKVELKNVETNVVSTIHTNYTGFYSSPPINPGQYSMTVSAAGFKTTIRSNIELRVGDRATLDFRMELGGTSETVSVTTEAPLLETASGSQSSTINKDLVASLPTYARNVFELVRYTAGVQGAARSTFGQRPFDNGDGSVSIAGGGGNTNEILLDGSPNTYRETSTPGNASSPPPDAVSEVKVQTNLYDAEYGRTGGGVITLSLKSGTNGYHGTASWLVRNDILNANTFESNAGGGTKTTFKMNQPTVHFQGPVRIPHLYDGRNRTFFMYALDLYRDSRPNYTTMIVPTDLERTGDFSRTFVSGTSGATISIYDPLSTIQNGSKYARTPFPDKKIPAALINPIAARVMGLLLHPNLSNIRRGQPNRLDTPNFDHEPFNSHVWRADHALTGKHRLFVSGTYSHRGQTNGLGYGFQAYEAAGTPYVSSSYRHWRDNHSLVLNLTSMLAPTFVATTRASWIRHEFAIDLYGFGYNPAKLGYPASLVAQAQSVSFPAIQIGGYTDVGPTRGGGNILNFSDTWAIGETLSRIVGDHSLRFGGDARLMLNNQSSPVPTFRVSTSAAFTRADPLVASAASGDGLASFLLGYPSAVSSTYNNYPAQGQRYFGFFLQDDWRITRKLTLNLGIRWEYESPISDRFNHQVIGFDTTTLTSLVPGGPQVRGGLLFADGKRRLAYKRDWNNFGPRLGYAYQLASRLVIRGGWAITYDPTADVAPTTGFSITTSPSTSIAAAGMVPLTTPGCSPPSCGMLSNPFPTGILQPMGSSRGLLTNAGSSISYIWPDRAVPYSHTFSTGIQYQLPFRSVLQVSYNGRRARNLGTSRNLNSVTYEQYRSNGSNLTATSTQVANPYAGLLPGTSLNGARMTLQQSLLPYPQFTGITETDRSIGVSRYDSMQLQLEKRLSSGLTVLFTATFQNGATRSTYLYSGMDAIGQFIVRDSGAEPYIINLNSTYSLPFFGKAQGWRRTLLSGWRIAGFGQWRAGSILNVSGATSTGIDPGIGNASYAHRFNTCTFNNNTNARQNCASAEEPVAWIIQKPFTLLTVPNPQWGSVRTRIPLSADLSLWKTFKTERVSADLRADASNAFNTPRFGNPNMNAASSLFGMTTLTQANMPRSIQLGLKVSF
ncbi:MAG: carboxypeptidase regulatory-like domain-containing protein [Acidobacteria bacterium]|nr:carboxypeptidase regulatory-like domain-containing protein [Acidobacteriota bacterium]